MKIEIEANLQFEGIHHWSNADTIPGVSFLKYPHRHIFHIRLRKVVQHDDRDIEFINFKSQVEEYVGGWRMNLGAKSCEMIAMELLKMFKCSSVRVMEDGENGAIVYAD